MKNHRIYLSLVLTSCLSVAAVGVPTNSYSQSQTAINQAAQSDYQTADAELNRVYKAVRTRHKDNKAFLQKLKESQRLWIKFRDAEVAMRYPAEDKKMAYGSSYPMCAEALLTELTQARIKTLRQWLDDAVEGDVCSGSLALGSPSSPVLPVFPRQFHGTWAQKPADCQTELRLFIDEKSAAHWENVGKLTKIIENKGNSLLVNLSFVGEEGLSRWEDTRRYTIKGNKLEELLLNTKAKQSPQLYIRCKH